LTIFTGATMSNGDEKRTSITSYQVHGWYGSQHYHSGAPRMVPQQRAGSNDYIADLQDEGVYVWPADKLPIKVFIEDCSGVPGYRSSMKQILVNCFDTWTEASQGRAWKQVDSPERADIVCRFTAALGLHNGDQEAGKTQTTVARRGGGAEMCDEANMSLLTQLNGRVFSDEDIQRTALHEVGHALGIQGHSPSANDIMYYAVNHQRPGYLSKRDVKTLLKMYSDYPSSFTIGSSNTGRTPRS
jgi:hypothetical protein